VQDAARQCPSPLRHRFSDDSFRAMEKFKGILRRTAESELYGPENEKPADTAGLRHILPF
jgi:hypothetical protein